MHYYTESKLQSKIHLEPTQKQGGLSPVLRKPIRDLTRTDLPKKYRMFPYPPAPPNISVPTMSPDAVTLLSHPHQNLRIEGLVTTGTPIDSIVPNKIRATSI